jgi:hypothetical protein
MLGSVLLGVGRAPRARRSVGANQAQNIDTGNSNFGEGRLRPIRL